jgi:hypothetical protein
MALRALFQQTVFLSTGSMGVSVRRPSFVRALNVLVFAAACGQDASPLEDGSGASGVAARTQALLSDSDGDGVGDASDNCPSIANPRQDDREPGGPGDACELSLRWSYGLLADYARYQSHKELVTFFAPLRLTGRPDLLRVRAPAPQRAMPLLSPLTQRLGVQSRLELLPGHADMISGDEVLSIEIGSAAVLGGARASEVWLRIEGSASVSVSFFDGTASLGSVTAANQGTALRSFAPASGALFDRIELRAASGRYAIKGPGQGVAFRLGGAQLPDRPGYEVVGGAYVDLDECAGLERVCDPLTTCTNLPGSFSCGPCPAGYRGTGESSCTDIDECAEQPELCSPLVACSNTQGGHQCGACPAGYRGDGTTCTDIDECEEDLDGCDALVSCMNQPGGFECGSCPPGYAGGGATGCTDIDECTGPDRACDALTACENSPGGFSCGPCPAGYRGGGESSCVDIDECAEGGAACSPLVTCSNTAGGYQCGDCPNGYRGDGFECHDVDECAEHSAQCSELVSCDNSVGSYSCGDCPSGYSGDGRNCTDIDECQASPCDPLTACGNSAGGFACGACPPGYAGNGHTGCVDIDECTDGSNPCSPLVSCANTNGGFGCGPCPSGYAGDGRSCADVDECAEQTDQCDALVICNNTQGSYNCGPCPAGFSGDGRSCTDIDECAQAPCDPLSACSNTVGSYACGACPPGYSGDGYAGCVDIDECAVDNGGCPPSERCDNTPGGRSCVPCPEGSVGVATQCGVGACAANGITSCVYGVVHDSCVPGTPASSDATCNSVDDDCDGTSDEEYVVQPSSCGVGACGTIGALSCVNGRQIDSCTPGQPLAAQDGSCDGIDDDCDGLVDDEFIGGACTATSAQVCVGGQLVEAASCADSFFCNGTESCSAGFCARTLRNLEDGNPCTLDSCSENTGVVHNDVPLGTSCSDADACNGSELCVSCVESANLLANPSFERVWTPTNQSQGFMPADWWNTHPNNADTYSMDGSWGLGPASFGNFSDVLSAADGLRWVAGHSGFTESFAQELRAPLVPGERYRLSARLHQSARFPSPGGYNVSLGFDYTVSSAPRATDLLLGRLATTSSTTGWVDVAFEFVAPASAGDRLLLNFLPVSATASAAYPGFDTVALVRACASSGTLSCQRQEPAVIDDGNACTQDSCTPAAGVVHAPLASGAACNGSGTCSASAACSNSIPVITSAPAGQHAAGSGDFTYQVVVSDADADPITFSRGTDATGAWTIDSSGLVRFVAPAAGMYVLSIQANDGRGGVVRQRRLLHVINGQLSPPMIATQPAQHALRADAPFSYQVRVWTPNASTPISFAFEQPPPAGMSIGAAGLVSWTPSAADVGVHQVSIRATIGASSVLHSFVVSVLP